MSARRQESLVRAPKSLVKLGYFCGKPYQDEVGQQSAGPGAC